MPDILFSYETRLGDAALMPPKVVACLGRRMGLLRPNREKVIPEYLLYAYLSPAFQETLRAHTVHGATVDRIALREMPGFPIRIPSLEEQEEVVAALKSIDGKIKLNRQTNQSLEHIAQAIFKSWFVDFEPTRSKIAAKQEWAKRSAAAKEIGNDTALPNEQTEATFIEHAAMAAISGKTLEELNQLSQEQQEQLKATAALFPDVLVDSELGEIPKGWEVMALDEIAHYQNGLALQKFRPENEQEYLPVLKIAQLKKGFADGVEKASVNIKPECIVDNGEIVFSWSGSLVVDVWCGGKVALNQHLFKVTSIDYPKWLYFYWTKHHLTGFQQIAADKAVTMGHIKRSHLAEAKCVLPRSDMREFDLIAGFLEKQVSRKLENNLLQQTRDALLPKLLSGELGVNRNNEEKYV